MNPGIEIDLQSTDQTRNADIAETDIDIRYVQESEIPLGASAIARAGFFPVCSPAMIKSSGLDSNDTFGIVEKATLLHELNSTQWSRWASVLGGKASTNPHRITFSNATISIEAALLGQGVALVNDFLDQCAARHPRIVDDQQPAQKIAAQ